MNKSTPQNKSNSTMVLKSDAGIEVASNSKKTEADGYKKVGNELFTRGNFYGACNLYTKAIDLVPDAAIYYGNRAAAYDMLKMYDEAINDAKKSVELDPNYGKGYLRLIWSLLTVGRVNECEQAFQRIEKLGLDIDAEVILKRFNILKENLDAIRLAEEKNDFSMLLTATSHALQVATGDNKIKLLKANALIHVGGEKDAHQLCKEVLEDDPKCVKALYVTSICLYLEDDLGGSMSFIRRAIQFDQHNSTFQAIMKKLKDVKRLRELGCIKFNAEKYNDAMDAYLQCLTIISDEEIINKKIQAKINLNLALITRKLGENEESLKHCSIAIGFMPNYPKAILLRARHYMEKEMYDCAVVDFETFLKAEPTSTFAQNELKKAKTATERANHKDYYEILNVPKNATFEDIRSAYKNMALLHHPDRHCSALQTEKDHHEKIFKKIKEAYDVLSDSMKRYHYDQHHQDHQNLQHNSTEASGISIHFFDTGTTSASTTAHYYFFF